MIKVCLICGKNFETNRQNKKCCSRECSEEHCRIQHRLFMRENWKRYEKRKVEMHPKQCVVCGETFFSKQDRRKCCSASCYDKYKRQNCKNQKERE